MDGQPFDALTAAFAGAASRRGALRLLAGALAAGLLGPGARGSAAQPGTCLGAGQACDARHGCCFHRCCGGVCCGAGDTCLPHGGGGTARPTQACCPAGQSAIDRCCASGEVGCFKTCCPPETVACGTPTKLPDGTVLPGTCVCPEGKVYRDGRCCLPENVLCEADGDCCSGGICAGGKPPHTCCLVNGSACTDWYQCCAGTCSDGRCCMDFGGSCAVDADCCRGNPCVDGWCGIPAGHACAADTACRSGFCRNGTCCIPQTRPEFTCADDAECCPGEEVRGPA
jgi:hypothetical protein